MTIDSDTVHLNPTNNTGFAVTPSNLSPVTIKPGMEYTVGTDVVLLETNAVVIDSSTVKFPTYSLPPGGWNTTNYTRPWTSPGSRLSTSLNITQMETTSRLTTYIRVIALSYTCRPNQRICNFTGNQTPTNSGKNTGLFTSKTTPNLSQANATPSHTSVPDKISRGSQGTTTGSWKSSITSPGVVTSVHLSMQSYTSEAITQGSTTITAPVTVSNERCYHSYHVFSERKAHTTVF